MHRCDLNASLNLLAQYSFSSMGDVIAPLELQSIPMYYWYNLDQPCNPPYISGPEITGSLKR